MNFLLTTRKDRGLAHYGEKRPVKQDDQYMGLVLLAQQILQTVNMAINY